VTDDESVEPFQPSLSQPETAFPKEKLAVALRGLANRGILIGTSSWRYDGWLGQLYTPERYYSRGRFSATKFKDECIQEYAEVFPVVGGDFSFYAPPTPEFWQKLFARAPRELKWSLKAPEDFTVKRFPQHPRYGPRRGLENPTFLDPESFEVAFLEPLAPYLDRVAVVIFELGRSHAMRIPSHKRSLTTLEPSSRSCRAPSSVEIRNEELLCGGYFDVLRTHSVAHVFNSWTRMPSLAEQLEIEEAWTAPHTVARALLRPGRAYDQSVAMFSPYREIREPYPEVRDSLRTLVRESMGRKRTYIHINNRLEGNAIETIRAIVD
jgi:uncharacterized protein YecE (DUF72 family)